MRREFERRPPGFEMVEARHLLFTEPNVEPGVTVRV